MEQIHGSVDVVIETVQKSSKVYKCDQCELRAEVKEILKAHTQEHKERINVGSSNFTGCNYIGIRKEFDFLINLIIQGSMVNFFVNPKESNYSSFDSLIEFK